MLPESKNQKIKQTDTSIVPNHTSRIFATRLKKWSSDPSFWIGFWSQNGSNIEKRWFRNRFKNHCNFPSDFSSILALHWTPQTTLKFSIFHDLSLLVSLLGHLGAKRVPKVLQDGSGGRFSKNLETFWAKNVEGFLKILNFLFNIISIVYYTLFDTISPTTFHSQEI